LANDCGAKITRAFVDSGPVQEKEWAVRCGVGWQGKNTLIINRKGGSFFFIGIIFTDLTVEPDPSATGLCGSCDRCVKACPTGALDTPYHLNVIRCISYHTIENRKEIPPEIGSKLNRRIYGCDICQDACPYNRAARPNSVPEFTIPEQLRAMRTKDWLSLNEEDFNRIFEDTPVKRIGYAKLMANIRAASPSGTFPG
ncbi:MAG TPA: tRNA epoxyqueuosine(34) reductase QueG, partial [Bacteroidales bacterium]|nr:tRNA epoxyqueuosine(34) reductase QueG [Bacteroidales bacterium]